MNDTKKRNYASINDVDDAVQKIVSHGDDHFSTSIWKDSSTLERIMLSAASEELTNKQLDSISFDIIYDKISTVKVYPKKECVDTINNFISKDILMDNKGSYSFPVNLFRKWLSEKHPLMYLRDEIED